MQIITVVMVNTTRRDSMIDPRDSRNSMAEFDDLISNQVTYEDQDVYQDLIQFDDQLNDQDDRVQEEEY